MSLTDIFPSIDLMGGKVVRLVKGDPNSKIVYSDDPLRTAKEWKDQGAAALHVVDLDGAFALGSNSGVIERLNSAVRIPIQLGGGIRNTSIVDGILDRGISRIVLGTLAFEEPEGLASLVARRGSERVVVALDYEGDVIVTRGWTSKTRMTIVEGLDYFADLGVKQFLMTSRYRDGTKSGPDIKLLRQVCHGTDARVQAAGGVGSLADVRSVKAAGASALIIGRAFYDHAFTVKEAIAAAK